MTRFLFLTGLLAFFLGLVGPVVPALAQDQTQLPSQRHSTRALSNVSAHQLPDVDVESLRAEDARRTDEVAPYRYGTVLDTDLRPERHGTWERLPSGHWLWRLRIHSRDAVSLSVGFSQFQLPEDATLFVSDPGGRVVHGPYTDDDGTNGQHRTPLVESDELIIELEVSSSRRADVALTVDRVVHGYRSLRPSQEDEITDKAGACNLDVTCDEADPWRAQVRSVARYTYEVNGSSYVCTGSLVNNTAEDKTPFFLTAEHCVPSPDVAETMVFYWNYENDTCRTPGSTESGEVTDDELDETSSGAILRARYGNVHADETISGKSDLTLVEVDDDIPPSYQLFFNGWSREDRPTQESVTIHHPQGHGKRISFDEDPSSITAYAENNGGDTHLRIGNWELGTTEGGSSGSPLYDTNQRVVGVLSGGAAGCDGDGDADDNNEPDWYGRIALGFENGDYQDATLADWLDPTDSGTETLDGRNLTSDSIAPARASNFRVETVTPDSVTLQWTAPGDDGMTGTANEYLVRYQVGSPIDSASFANATPVPEVPQPEPAGTEQSVTIAVEEDSSYYFGLVVRDEVKNASPLSATEQDATPVRTLRVTSSPAPNPARGRVSLQFVVEEPQPVRAELYDPLGRRVRVLLDEELPPFRQQTLTTDVSSLSSGMYFVRIRGKFETRTEQIAVVQ